MQNHRCSFDQDTHIQISWLDLIVFSHLQPIPQLTAIVESQMQRFSRLGYDVKSAFSWDKTQVIVIVLQSGPSCSSCHTIVDSLGLEQERWYIDGLVASCIRYRTLEKP